jgi:pyruvate dehydrogenase E2 component (dihydrolipoamide acetyltransferase)
MAPAGENIAAGEVVVRIELESAFLDVEAPTDGRLVEILAPVGTTLQAGQPLARADAAAGALSSSSASSQSITKTETTMTDTSLPENVIPILMPQVGNDMEEGTMVKWIVSEGDTVETGDILFEVETDKATVEIEADAAGRLARIVAPEGEIVPIKQPVAYLADDDDEVDAYLAANGSGASAEQTPPPPGEVASPRAGGGEAPEGVTPILMPQVGNDMEEGTIVKWTVSEGDAVEAGQIIFEVETDKATIEIEADAAGTLARIVAGEGETVAIKTPVAYLGDDDAAVDAYIAWETAQSAPAETKQTPKPETSRGVAPAAPRSSVPAQSNAAAEQVLRRAQKSQTAAPAPGGRIKASPAARRFAAERGVDLAAIAPGSGPGGRVISTDVLAAPTGGAAAGAPQVAPVSPQGAALGNEDIVTELPTMRRAIARNLTASKQNVPHFTMKLTFDADPMMTFYRARKQQHSLSVNDVVVKAVAAALSEFPAFRSRFEETQITERPRANVGVAVGTDDGLRVPVVMNADLLSLPELAEESRRVIQNARDGKLENVGEGVLTVSNLGMFGIEEFSAIINPPEAAILAVGAVREAVIVSGGAIKPSRVCTMTLSCDHRVVDGLVAAQFAARLKDLLENPQLLSL